MNRFNKLAPHKFKAAGLAISILAIILFAILKILNYNYQDGWHDRIFIFNHYVIIVGLFMILYSRENRDDERVQKIRYTLLKLALAITVGALMLYVTVSTLDRVEFSIFVILYIIEGVLIVYNLAFRYCLVKDPAWIFEEKEMNNSRFYILISCLILLLVWIVYVVAEYKI